MNTTTNRTFWPVSGGAVALQPGWFQGHATAQIFINLGFGTDGPDGGPPNMSNPMVPQFGIIGPSKNPYPGTICLPQVPLPVNASVKAGDNATIQVVELAVHGAALYSVSTDHTLLLLSLSLSLFCYVVYANRFVFSASTSHLSKTMTRGSRMSTRPTASTAPILAFLTSTPSLLRLLGATALHPVPWHLSCSKGHWAPRQYGHR